MVRRIVLAAGVLGLVLTAFAAAPAALAGDPCFHDLSRPAATTGSSTAIAIDECTFGPTVSYVAVGAEVTWRNAASQPHEVVGANLTWGAHKKMLQPGDSIGWTFDRAGVFPYTCMLHPGMTGAIVVGAPATAGADTGPAEPDAQAASAVTTGDPSGASDPPDGGALAAGAGLGASGAIAVVAALALVRRRRAAHG